MCLQLKRRIYGFDFLPRQWQATKRGSTSIRAFWNPPDKPEESEIGQAIFIPYAVSHFRVEYANPPTGIPVSWWRSVEDSMSGFTVESFVDELAAAAGVDPLEFRLRLIGTEPRKLPNPLWPEGAPLETQRFRSMLELAAQKAGWGKPLEGGRARGIAGYFSFNSYVAQVAEVSINKSGVRVHRVVCAVDCGRAVNPDGVKAQMESAVVYALTAALYGEITIENGAAKQSNFNDYPMLRMRDMPEIEVHIVPSAEAPRRNGRAGRPAARSSGCKCDLCRHAEADPAAAHPRRGPAFGLKSLPQFESFRARRRWRLRSDSASIGMLEGLHPEDRERHRRTT